MQFVVMKWVSQEAMPNSIYGVFDNDNSRQLPSPSPTGHWQAFRVIDEKRFKFAREAREAIADFGYYLMGVSVTITEAFDEPPTSN